MLDTETARSFTTPALRINQNGQHVFVLGLDAATLEKTTAVSRVHRTASGLHGYQRPEVGQHIRGITRYLESTDAILPNAIVVAFDTRTTFTPATADNATAVGTLTIPLDANAEAGLIVDGQQRVAAIRDATVNNFHVPVVAFIASSSEQERSQFVLVNNTKPLPSGLVNELVADIDDMLPPRLMKRQLPARVVVALNNDPASPFHRRITAPTNADGDIKDNSVLRMIASSITEGVLYHYRYPDGDGDVNAMAAHVTAFFNRVQAAFPTAWALPPRKSRLTHGAGIFAMGSLMNGLTESPQGPTIDTAAIDAALQRVAAVAAWTSGQWTLPDGTTRSWNGIENTSGGLKTLTAIVHRAAAPLNRHSHAAIA